jgi:hypothetical protein
LQPVFGGASPFTEYAKPNTGEPLEVNSLHLLISERFSFYKKAR